MTNTPSSDRSARYEAALADLRRAEELQREIALAHARGIESLFELLCREHRHAR